MLPDSRHCLKCALIKPLDEFSKAPRGKYGRKARCKACDADRHAALHPPKPREVWPKRREAFTGDELKTCKTCEETKPLTEYYLARRATETANAVYKPTCKACNSAKAIQWFRDNPDRAAAASLRGKLRMYGLTPEDYDALLAEQGGVCAMCGGEETTIRKGALFQLSVDHCHDTGRVRGLLCNKCNRAIGLLGDNPALLRRGADYLERA